MCLKEIEFRFQNLRNGSEDKNGRRLTTFALENENNIIIGTINLRHCRRYPIFIGFTSISEKNEAFEIDGKELIKPDVYTNRSALFGWSIILASYITCLGFFCVLCSDQFVHSLTCTSKCTKIHHVKIHNDSKKYRRGKGLDSIFYVSLLTVLNSSQGLKCWLTLVSRFFWMA